MRHLFQKHFWMSETIRLLVVPMLGVTVVGCAAAMTPITATSTSCKGNSAGDIMVKVGPLCIDKYEASVWSRPDGTGNQYGAYSKGDDFPETFPDTGNWIVPLYAVSKAGVMPSGDITWFQAQQACALSGKRLLTNAEWQMAAAGTPDGAPCIVSTSGPQVTGTPGCVSKWGTFDMTGNLAEWVADWMRGNTIPWAPRTRSNGTTTSTYGGDLIYGINPAETQRDGLNFPAALLRGGDWGMWSQGTSAGVFALTAAVPPFQALPHCGFRCARLAD